jgi:hypothetical protein
MWQIYGKEAVLALNRKNWSVDLGAVFTLIILNHSFWIASNLIGMLCPSSRVHNKVL